MSTTAIPSHSPRIAPWAGDSVRAPHDNIDTAPLSNSEKRIVDELIASYRLNPIPAVSWVAEEAAIRQQFHHGRPSLAVA